ncbi:hypothetical protein BJX61DRAFT_530850 [Aspergillus egyptiacus]|nr:hypothetical protein BJX61DRAFT_530850 [Aspergillus egyptiacus]
MGLILPDEIDLEDNDTLSQIHVKLEHLAALYNSGKKLFPRHLLEDLDSQIDQGKDEVRIDDLDDIPHTYSLKVPAWCADFATTYRIGYSSIQNLTCIHPSFPELSLRDNSPVSICYTSSAEYHVSPLKEVQTAFSKSLLKWEESETCKTLQYHLSTIKFSKPIRKIIGFGLGTLSELSDEYHMTRAHAQHAAMGTMVRALLKARGAGANLTRGSGADGNGIGGDEEGIRCYAQDPAYTDVDVELLRGIGITTLDDPKGFLEVDEQTLVFSVSPNVPVKQVVADVQWPGGMIWNTVSLVEKEARWEKKVRDGEEYWVFPFTTDPDSQRVRKMVQHYTTVPLRDSNEYFGDLTIYAR